jgi:hypothetical protein
MNFAHVHLLLNHLSPLGVLFGLLLLAAALLRKSDELLRASLVTLVVAGLLALPTYYTGEPAEKVADKMPGVTEEFIAPHEDSAEKSLVGALILAALSVTGLLLYRGREIPRAFALVTLALAVIVTGMLAWTAHLGGLIRHVEIR